MGAVDVARQQPNVLRMQALGAKVVPVQSGRKTLKDAMNEALRDWVTNVDDTFYCIGTVAGPHPYPGDGARLSVASSAAKRASRCWRSKAVCPDSLVACIGGGSNAMGLFHPFLDDQRSRFTASRRRAMASTTALHAASLSGGRPGVLHGNRTYLLMNDDGQINDAHSISAGLDYPGIGPEHSWLHEIGRVNYLSATDQEALDAFQLLIAGSRASFRRWRPAHALARVMRTRAKAKPRIT